MIKTLQILRILDEKGVLSLTNLSLITAIIKALLAPQLSAYDIALAVIALISYQYKRYAESKVTNTQAYEARVNAMESNLNLLKTAMALKTQGLSR